MDHSVYIRIDLEALIGSPVHTVILALGFGAMGILHQNQTVQCIIAKPYLIRMRRPLVSAHFVINFDCPWIYLRCILCGLPDLHLLYNEGFLPVLRLSPLTSASLPSSAGGFMSVSLMKIDNTIR